MIEQHQACGAERGNLAGDLGPDRAGRPGQEDYSAAQVGAHRRKIEVHRHPSPQIVDPDIAKLVDASGLFWQFVQRGKGLELERGGDTLIHHAAHLGQVRCIEGDDSEFRPQPLRYLGQVVDGADYPDAPASPPQSCSEIYQAHDVQRIDLPPSRLSQELLRSIPRPHNQGAAPARSPRGQGALSDGAGEEGYSTGE